jgi:hypothetical protein
VNIKIKVNVKLSLYLIRLHDMNAHEGVEVQLHAFSPSAIGRGE